MVRLHEKYGLNPGMSNCYYCNKPFEIILFGAALEDEAKHEMGVMHTEPCPECKELMEQGIMLISIADGEEAELESANREKRIPNPYRTGCISVVKDEFIKRLVKPDELAEQIIKKRMCFIPDSAWDAIGLPRENVDNR